MSSAPSRKLPVLLRVWRRLHAFGYMCLHLVVALLARPLFGVRLVGPRVRLPPGPVIVCANHASFLDPIFLQMLVGRQTRFVMTYAFYNRPLGRWFYRLVAAIPVGAGHGARQGMERAVRALREGLALAIFPEGRLSRDGEVGEPERGVALVARMGGAAILPVGIHGAFEVWPWEARWFRRGDVRLAFGTPLPPPRAHQSKAEQQAYAEVVMARIADAARRAAEA